MTVYLLHFSSKLAHAQHYIGCTGDVNARMQRHRAGRGGALMRAVHRAGINVMLARTWQGGRTLERQLKNRKNAPRLCPICNPKLNGSNPDKGK